jgi:hypothetical protein
MADLSKETMKRWRELLPADIQSAVPEDFTGDETAVYKLCETVRATDLRDMRKVVDAHASLIEGMGRARRIKFLAWLSHKSFPYRVDIFADVVSGEGEGGNGRPVSMLFIEDIKALNEAIAARLARDVVVEPNVEAIKMAAFEFQNVPEFRREGP